MPNGRLPMSQENSNKPYTVHEIYTARVEAIKTSYQIGWNEKNVVDPSVVRLCDDHLKLKADLEQAQEKLAVLQAEKAEIEEENENLQAELRSLYQFTGNMPWVKAEVQRMREYEAWVKEGKG